MKMGRMTAAVLAVIIASQIVALAAKPSPSPVPAEPEIEYSGEYQAFEQIAEYVSDFYIDDSYSKDAVMKQGISELLRYNEPLLVELLKSTLESMDDYSEFYTEEEYKAFQDQLNHTFYGIGIVMKLNDDGYVEVADFVEGNDNAKNAGFKVGDKFLRVDGLDAVGKSVSQVREMVIGDEGTSVTVTVLRGDKDLDLTATRVAVNAATVSAAVLNGHIGYINISTFGMDTAGEFKEALDYMREQKVTKLILDLRNNGGGLVPAAVEIAQAVVPKGKIIDVKYRDPKYDMTYTSNLAKKEFDIAVLVNELTASASEILASAIQDSKAGELVGVQTFGKAVIQNTYPLDNGSRFKLTVGQYITRNGNEINKKGLTPDVEVENVVEKYDTSELEQFDYTERTALGQKSPNALAAKQRLAVLGYYKGEENDVYDAMLYDAVKVFQLKNDIFDYGVLDIPTQTLIEEQAADLDVMDDKQLEEAYKKLGGNIDELYNNGPQQDETP